MRKSTIKYIIIILCAVIVLLGAFFAVKELLRAYELRQAEIEYPLFDGSVVIKHCQGEDYYVYKKAYEGEHDIQEICEDYLVSDGFECCTVMDYDEYHSFCETWELTEKYNDPDMNYIVVSYAALDSTGAKASLAAVDAVDLDHTSVKLYLWYKFYGVGGDIGIVCIIPTKQPVTDVDVVRLTSEREYYYIHKYGVPYDPNEAKIPFPT